VELTIVAGTAVASDGFLPDPDHARWLSLQLHQWLAESLGYLFEVCALHTRLDKASFDARIAEVLSEPRIRPEVFLLHHEIVAAAQMGEAAEISGAFAAFAAAEIAAPAGLRQRGWQDESFSSPEALRYRSLFEDEGDSPLRLTAPMPTVFADARSCLDAALGVLQQAVPALHDEINVLLTEMVFVEGNSGGGTIFGGVTCFHAQGAIALNVAEHLTMPGALAGLVHEAAHTLLFAASAGAPLVENDPAERFPSPLRHDPRPMNRTFHATFVSARMAYAIDQVLAHGAVRDEDRADLIAIGAAARSAFDAGYGVLIADGRPTPLGQSLLQAAAHQMRATAIA